jgi:hypothetical protein
MSSNTALSNAIKFSITGDQVTEKELDMKTTYTFNSKYSSLYGELVLNPSENDDEVNEYFESIMECCEFNIGTPLENTGYNLDNASFEYKFVKYNKNTGSYDVRVKLIVPDYTSESVETTGGDAYYKILENFDNREGLDEEETDLFSWSPVIKDVYPFAWVHLLTKKNKEAEYVFVEAESRRTECQNF